MKEIGLEPRFFFFFLTQLSIESKYAGFQVLVNSDTMLSSCPSVKVTYTE